MAARKYSDVTLTKDPKRPNRENRSGVNSSFSQISAFIAKKNIGVKILKATIKAVLLVFIINFNTNFATLFVQILTY